MRILEVATYSGTHYLFTLPLAKHLRTQGHEVVFVCSDDKGEFNKSFVPELRAEGFEVMIVPLKRHVSMFSILSDLKAAWMLYWKCRERAC